MTTVANLMQFQTATVITVVRAIAKADYLEYRHSLARDYGAGLDLEQLLILALSWKHSAGPAEQDQISIVKDLLLHQPDRFSHSSNYHRGLLETACLFSSLKVIKLLLARGSRIECRLLVTLTELCQTSPYRDYYLEVLLLLFNHYQFNDPGLTWLFLYRPDDVGVDSVDGANLRTELFWFDNSAASRAVLLAGLDPGRDDGRNQPLKSRTWVLEQIEYDPCPNTVEMLVKVGLIDETSLEVYQSNKGEWTFLTKQLVRSFI